jgi:hypothetical protein
LKVSPDPYSGSYDISNPQSMNRYVYIENAPLSYFDSDGLVRVYTDPVMGGDWCYHWSWQDSDPPDGGADMGLGMACPTSFFPSMNYATLPASGWVIDATSFGYVGGGGGSAPNNGKTAKQILQCASKLANQYSIAGILGITESSPSDSWYASAAKTVGTAFLGNTFSGISDTVTHVATGNFGAGYVDVALGGYAQGLALGPNAPAAAVGIVGAATNAGVDAALGEGMAGPVGWAKLGIDAAVYGSALLYCKSH